MSLMFAPGIESWDESDGKEPAGPGNGFGAKSRIIPAPGEERRRVVPLSG